ncbi:MAG: hypothetical protein AAB466_13505, partial [Verrucomicrobiota bacterium]
PFSRYPIKYNLEDPWGILLPHLAEIKGICVWLQLKACAELAAGQSENALEDVKLGLYMGDSVKGEPVLISYLVRIACFRIATQPIWEGLAEHRWSDAQLQELQTRLHQYDFVADLKRTLAAERAAAILTADLLFRGKYRLSELSDETGTGEVMGEAIFQIAPHGWYYKEQLNYCRLFDTLFGTGLDTTQKQVLPSQIESNFHELERMLSPRRSGFSAIFHHRAIAGLLLPSLANVLRKSAEAQTLANQGALACALEQYRLSHGQFPDQLEALTPQFISQLPNDAITGKPYKYRRADRGQFVLYSVGWNEKDDGGTVALQKDGSLDLKNGDWVWEYPAK